MSLVPTFEIGLRNAWIFMIWLVIQNFGVMLSKDLYQKAGIRCAYVSLDMTGYTDPYKLGIPSNSGHACNAFETTDKGLVYIDCTGKMSSYGPSNYDKTIIVQIGMLYIPRSLFPEPGWQSTWESMGTVTNIFMTWDGNWNN
jgi:hypothetical protein